MTVKASKGERERESEWCTVEKGNSSCCLLGARCGSSFCFTKRDQELPRQACRPQAGNSRQCTVAVTIWPLSHCNREGGGDTPWTCGRGLWPATRRGQQKGDHGGILNAHSLNSVLTQAIVDTLISPTQKGLAADNDHQGREREKGRRSFPLRPEKPLAAK